MKKLSLFLVASVTTFYGSAQIDSAGLDKIFERKGTVTGNVYRVTFPRTDLRVTINDFPVAPGLALTSWVALHRMGTGSTMRGSESTMMGGESTMMGDLCMLDSEEPVVVAKLVELGLEVTAIHNHLVGEKPAIKFLHFSGRGDALTLAGEIKQVFALTATPLGKPATLPPVSTPDWSAVEAVLGSKGRKNGTVLSYGFPRKEKLMEGGMEMPAPMGMATGINLQMENGRVATTGDFVLLADEVNKVVAALEKQGITVTAIHNHMLYDEPRLFMLHFWGVGEPGKIAAGLKAALEKTNSKL